MSTLSLRSAKFAALARSYPEVGERLRELGSQRLREFQTRCEQTRAQRDRWTKAAIGALQDDQAIPTPSQLRRARGEHRGTGLAVWLGMLLDRIPESIVIGGSFAGLVAMQMMQGPIDSIANLIPCTLVAQLFLANLPEALSRCGIRVSPERESWGSSSPWSPSRGRCGGPGSSVARVGVR